MSEQTFAPDRELDEALALLHDREVGPVDLGGRDPTYPDFPRAEHSLRYARLTALLEAYDLDALVLTQEESVRYLSGYVSVIWAVGRWLPGVLIAPRDPRDAVLVPSAFDVGAATGTSWVGRIDGHPDAAAIPDLVAGHLRRLGLRLDRIGMETGPGAIVMLPWPVAQALAAALGGAPVDATRLLSVLRMVKSEAELARIRRAVGATTSGYRAALEAAKAGMTERELVSAATSTMHRDGVTAGTRPTFLNCVSGRDRYPRPCWTSCGAAWPSRPSTPTPRSRPCRAATSRRSCSAAGWPGGPECCCWTSRPGASTSGPRPRSTRSCRP
jgi:Creatinase/Prolidase N-terminal domain